MGALILTKSDRDYIRLAREVGIENISVEPTGSGHRRLTGTVGGKPVMTFYSCQKAFTDRNAMNNRASLRKIVARAGASS